MIPRDGRHLRRVLEVIAGLKGIPRQGWIEHGMPRDAVESVAAHSFGTAALAIVLREAGLVPATLDFEKVLVLAVLHDITESRTGDITPRGGVPGEEKRRLEHEATDVLFDRNGSLNRLNDMLHAFIDASPDDGDEHGMVKRLDKLDMMLQAITYERAHDVNLSGFHARKEYLAADGPLERVLAAFKEPPAR